MTPEAWVGVGLVVWALGCVAGVLWCKAVVEPELARLHAMVDLLRDTVEETVDEPERWTWRGVDDATDKAMDADIDAMDVWLRSVIEGAVVAPVLRRPDGTLFVRADTEADAAARLTRYVEGAGDE